MILSAKPVMKTSPFSTSASMLNSGPSIISSTITSPLWEFRRASATACDSSIPVSTLLTPREPMLSTGLTTSGKESTRTRVRGSSPSAIRTKRGAGIPFSANTCRITTLSLAARAVRGDTPGRPRASATLATV